MQGHISLATTTEESMDLLRIALKLAKLKQVLSVNRLIMSNINTAVSQGKQSETQESQKEMMVITPTTKESFLQLLASQLHQSQFTLKTTSDQILLHISLATTTKESTDLLRIASKLVKLKKALFANRSIMSPTIDQSTATSQKKLSEN